MQSLNEMHYWMAQKLYALHTTVQIVQYTMSALLKIPQLKESSFQEAQRWEYAQALVCLSAPETQRCLELKPSVAASRRALQYVLLQSLLYSVIGKIARPSSDCTTLLPDLPNSCLHNFDSTRTKNIDWKSWLLLTYLVDLQAQSY